MINDNVDLQKFEISYLGVLLDNKLPHKQHAEHMYQQPRAESK